MSDKTIIHYIIIAASIILASLSSPLLAKEAVITKSGQIITGDISITTENTIKIKTRFGILEIPYTIIDSVIIEDLYRKDIRC